MTYELTNAGQLASVKAALGLRSRDLGIVFAGDSNTNGQIALAATTTAAGDFTGAEVYLSPLDELWGASGLSPYFRSDSQSNSTTSPNQTQDSQNSAVTTGKGSYISYVPLALRMAYPSVRKFRCANLGVGGSSSYTWAGEPANVIIRAIGQASDGDTVTIAGQAYRFKDTPAQAYDVQIAGSAALSLANLQNAINAEGSGWFAGTAVNPSAYAPNVQASFYLHVHALQTGTAGNSLVAAGSNQSGISPTNPGLTPVASQNFTNGSATSAIYANAKAVLAANGGFGTVDAFIFTLGSNDAGRPGFRGRNTQNELTTLITNVKTDFPGAKVILWTPNTLGNGNDGYLTSTINPAILAVAAADPTNVFVVDFHSLGMGSGNVAIVNTSDQLHLTHYGYSILASLVAGKLGSALALT